MNASALIEGIKAGDTASLARAISVVENGDDGFEELLSEIHSLVGNAHRIGITGPPGAGKSMLSELITREYRSRDHRVAVVAVDPTSPYSGGALLGDRIRMESVALDPDVYIRSMASRGATGGLATTTLEVCDILDAFGFGRIIIETVGVGQNELAIAATADTSALILVPESGDGIQVLKAGVMEAVDLFVVNKSDRPGADRMVQEVQVMLGFRAGSALRNVKPHHGPQAASTEAEERSGDGWSATVLSTSATKEEGIQQLVDVLEEHWTYLNQSGMLATRREARLERHVKEVVERTLRNALWQDSRGTAILNEGLDDVANGSASPYAVARRIVDGLELGAKK